MPPPVPATAVQLQSLVTSDETVQLSLETVEVPEPGPTEVLVRVEATPINPSDLGLLLAGADVAAAVVSGPPDRPVVTAPLPAAAMRAMAGRIGIPMPVGNEGAGTVVAAGSSPAAQALLGKTVAAAGGAHVRAVPLRRRDRCAWNCPTGTRAVDGASSFVNPMTALGMVETMRLENHDALVHTAAASNLGQMLNRAVHRGACPARQHRAPARAGRPPQVARRRLCVQLGCARLHGRPDGRPEGDVRHPGLRRHWRRALGEPDSDLHGGRRERGCAEATAGTARSVHKQVYIYGGLDRGPTELTRNFGMAWGIGGWLLTPFLLQIGLDGVVRLRNRVAAGLTTTFASGYTDQVSLPGALALDAIAAYSRQATGQKYLIIPQR